MRLPRLCMFILFLFSFDRISARQVKRRHGAIWEAPYSEYLASFYNKQENHNRTTTTSNRDHHHHHQSMLRCPFADCISDPQSAWSHLSLKPADDSLKHKAKVALSFSIDRLCDKYNCELLWWLFTNNTIKLVDWIIDGGQHQHQYWVNQTNKQTNERTISSIKICMRFCGKLEGNIHKFMHVQVTGREAPLVLRLLKSKRWVLALLTW